ncbi:glycosyltransferase [Cronbergia sp. UHCC 0137]|uniref:glycosyltransferase n=1 Tax=Cronbergia sp. UHCC 0137 TaxID=3110239 RepID=UPI002B1FDD4C|nr:glycosyltransferase [Cronbergia sp. UHCC 0137]MEA5618840.1 glycosyltransferase [Cronbergia sp. UHCC 0137]
MKAVVTLCIGEAANNLGEVTHPLLKAYANRIGADFIVINNPNMGFDVPYYEKYQIYNLLEKYNRIIYLDTDIIVSHECPDLFKIVSEDNFGAFLVSKHTYFHDGAVKDIQKELGDIGWDREYFNSGVMVVSQHHRQIFAKDNNLVIWASCTRAFPDQTILNYTVQKQGILIDDIGYKFNHTTDPKNSRARLGRRINQILNLYDRLLSAVSSKYKKYVEEKYKNNGYIVHYKGKEPIKHRFQSYMIHYTGKGHRLKGSKIDQIQKDLSIINNKILSQAISWIPFLERFV